MVLVGPGSSYAVQAAFAQAATAKGGELEIVSTGPVRPYRNEKISIS